MPTFAVISNDHILSITTPNRIGTRSVIFSGKAQYRKGLRGNPIMTAKKPNFYSSSTAFQEAIVERETKMKSHQWMIVEVHGKATDNNFYGAAI